MATVSANFGNLFTNTHLFGTDSKIVLYMPWTIKSEREKQKAMSDAYINLARKLKVLVAPVSHRPHRLRRLPEAGFGFPGVCGLRPERLR